MRDIAKGKFMGPFIMNIQSMEGILVHAVKGALRGLRREKEGWFEARVELLRALAIGEQALGPRHPEVGTVLNNLGGLMWQLGEPTAERAEPHPEGAALVGGRAPQPEL
mgnify:CR=1 FL=1